MADIDNVSAIIEAARARDGAITIEVGGDAVDFAVPMLARPIAGGGVVVESIKAEIDRYRLTPERRRGTAKLLDLDSFIAHALRFKDANSAVFVTEEPPSFTSVLNYHEALNGQPGESPSDSASPRFGDHRGVYVPAFSPEWKAWVAGDGKDIEGADARWLAQDEFSSLIVDNARDIFDTGDARPGEALGDLPSWFASRFGRGIDPSKFFAGTQRLLDLAEGLTVSVEDRVEDTAKLDGGAQTIAWSGKTTTSVEVPSAFVIAIPVFDGGDPYQIPARLRFKLVPYGESKRVTWKVDLYGVKRTLRACLADMREKVKSATGLPSFMGAPE